MDHCARRYSCDCATTSTRRRSGARWRPTLNASAPGRALRPEPRRADDATDEVGATNAKPKSTNSEIDDVVQQLDNTKNAFPIAVGAHRSELTSLDRIYWPADPALKQAGPHQARFAALHRADLPVHAAASAGSAADDDPNAGRHPWPALLPETLGAGAARVCRRESRCFPATRTRVTTTCCATTCRRCCGSRNRARSNSTSGIRARSRGRDIGREEHRLRKFAASRSKSRSSTFRTTWCSTSIRTSTRARRRPATSPS